MEIKGFTFIEKIIKKGKLKFMSTKAKGFLGLGIFFLIGLFAGGTSGLKIFWTLLGILFIFLSLKYKGVSPAKERKASVLKFLSERDFQVSKEVRTGKNLKAILYIDDSNKKFAISLSNKSMSVFNYSDLIDFELNEDGNSITKGKGLATVAGGMAFGPLGALAGMSGKRKNESTCTLLVVRLMVNNLNDPQIVIPFIENEVKKNTPQYKLMLERAKELSATLSYIDNNKTA